MPAAACPACCPGSRLGPGSSCICGIRRTGICSWISWPRWRAAITVNFHPRYVGLVFAPALDFDMHDLPHLRGWDFGVLAGPRFTDRTYNQTIYGVPAAYATPSRRAYSAAGGYAGAQFTAAVSRRFASFWLGAFVRYDELRGAVFTDSPLVRQRDAVSFGFAAAWIFAQSHRMVDVAE